MPGRLTHCRTAALGCLVVALLTAGCGARARSHTGAIVVKAAQWPQADALFRRDPRWLSSDGAYSLPLRDGRILWLFGDTVVEPNAPYVRTHAYLKTHAAFLRNTVAIQHGSDPTTAPLRYYWRSSGRHPVSFFPEQGADWYWPADAVQVDRSLVVFLDRITANPKGTPGWNFQGAGWRLAVITDDSKPPTGWRVRLVAPPSRFIGSLDPGEAVTRVGGWVVSLAVPERAGLRTPGYLVRWPARELAVGRLRSAEWWTGSRGWLRTSNPRLLAPVMADVEGGDSLTFDRKLGRWIMLGSRGFGATTIDVAFATRIEGPWSKHRFVYRPPESNSPTANVYAAKGHAELTGTDLAVTYSTDVYPYLRFVKLSLSRR
jgi:hypothetical protein